MGLMNEYINKKMIVNELKQELVSLIKKIMEKNKNPKRADENNLLNFLQKTK